MNEKQSSATSSASGVVLHNAWIVDIDPPAVQWGSLRVEGERIAAVGPAVAAQPGDQTLDVGGAVVLPGLVNGHTHLYSALAVGMPPPPRPPRNFHEILQLVWWRLDRALDLPLIGMSAAIGALDALRCGTTTLIDHHASPSEIAGSLDAVESGLAIVGLRGVLCYETTDRNGSEGREAGIRENERYLKKCGGTGLVAGEHRRDAGATPATPDTPGTPGDADARFAGLSGAHAAFTLEDEALAAAADVGKRHGAGVHIHVAEDPCDGAICREQYGGELLDRLERAGVLALPSILAHGTHLGPADLERVNASPVVLAHNTRSNMNNAVGYAPLQQVRRPVLLGTDGIGSDMLAELATAWFQSCDRGAGLNPADCVAMLAASARRASESLGVPLGHLRPGAAADIVVTDYMPATPLTADNLAGHLIFGMSSRHVRNVMVAGQWRLLDRQVLGLDESDLRRKAMSEAKRLWDRMQLIS